MQKNMKTYNLYRVLGWKFTSTLLACFLMFTRATQTTTEAPALGVDCSNKTDADNWCNATITGEAKCGTDGKCSCASLHFSVNNITCIPETDLIPIDLSTPAITINSLNIEWSKKDSVRDLHLSYTVEAKPANTYVGAGLGVVTCTVETGQMRAACTGLGSGYNYNVTVSTLYASVQTNYFQTIQNSTVPSTPGPLNTSASSFNAPNVFLVWTPSQGKVDIYHIKVFQTYEPHILKNLSTNNSNLWIYITDLTPGTNYTFNITAYSYGKSSGETVGTFRTDTTVPGPPGQLQLVRATMNSIKIRWTVTGTPNGDIKGHQVCIKYKFYEDQPYTSLECKNTTHGNTVEYERTGLFAGTTYQFDVYTINDKFISIDSATLQQHTHESFPGKVSELRAIPNDININVTWQRPSRPNGDITAYQIQWTRVLGQQNCTLYTNLENSTMKTMRQCSHNISQPDESLENIEYVIRNMMPHTGYLIEVRAYTSVGTGEVSNITVYTNVSVSNPVKDVSVVVLNATSVNVSWTIPDSNPGPVKYTVTANNMVDNSSANQSCSVQNYTSSSCVVPGLQEYWVYNFSVVASTDAGSSKATVSDSKTTKEAVPGIISDYSFELYNTTENCDATKVTIHWEEPELLERNSLIVKYTFYVDETPKLTYSVTNPRPYSQSNRKFTETFVELMPEVLHTWKVSAVSNQDTAGEETIFKITQGVCAPPGWQDKDIKAFDEISSTPSTVTIQLPSNFFQNSQQGNIVEKGLIVLPKESKFFDETSSINHSELITWASARSLQFEKEYKVNILEDVTDQFVIGKDCKYETTETAYNFCNGPLPEQFFFRIAAFACTKRAINLLCTTSIPFGPFTTKKSSVLASDAKTSNYSTTTVIVGVVLGIIVVVLAATTVCLTIKLRKIRKDKDELNKNNKKPNREHHVYMNEAVASTVQGKRDSEVVQSTDNFDSQYASLDENCRDDAKTHSEILSACLEAMGAKHSFPKTEIPKDRTFVVTGANRGIGYEVTKWIAMLGGTVVMACRSEDDAMRAMRQMDKEYKEEKSKGTPGLVDTAELSLVFMKLDLSSLQSVKEFVQQYKESGRQLHVLICNAGVSKAKPEITGDGFEYMLQVNYLSHFLLIAKLLPMMKKNEVESRIVLVSSAAHKMCRYEFENINFKGDASKFGVLDYYGRSKLYQIMQMHCLDRRLRNSNVSVTSAHPGMVDTEIGAEFKDRRAYQFFVTMCRLIGAVKNPMDGATTIINCAVNPALESVGGVYYQDCQPASTTSVARDDHKQEELWNKTLEFLQGHLSEEELYCLEGADP